MKNHAEFAELLALKLYGEIDAIEQRALGRARRTVRGVRRVRTQLGLRTGPTRDHCDARDDLPADWIERLRRATRTEKSQPASRTGSDGARGRFRSWACSSPRGSDAVTGRSQNSDARGQGPAGVGAKTRNLVPRSTPVRSVRARSLNLRH